MIYKLVLDNSVTMRWCFDDDVDGYAKKIIEHISDGNIALVPPLWRYEVVSVLARAQKIGSLGSDRVQNFLSYIAALQIEIEYTSLEKIMTNVYQLAVHYSLTGYDAAYLELAMRKKLPLATLDKELQFAAKAAGVPLFAIE